MNNKTVFSLLFVGAALLFGSSGAMADTIRCESNGGNYKSCSVDTRGGVRLSRQLSSQGCWQNDTWGYDRNRIWVNRGCRAEFWVGDRHSGSSSNDKVAGAVALGLVTAAIISSNRNKNRDNNSYNNNRYDDSYMDDGYDNRYDNYGGNPRRTFRCESTSQRFVYCSLPARGHVEVFKQLSSSSCIQGRSWGTENNRVWVSNGCRAEFAVY